MWLVVVFTPAGGPTRARVRRFSRFLIRATGCPFTIAGEEHLAAHPSAVLVANHVSYLDAVVLLAALPRDSHFVANHEAAAWPLIGIFIRKSEYVIVDRDSRASRVKTGRAMVDLLDRGHSLVLFPEGGIGTGELRPFQSGAFRTAAKTGRPVLPVAISGTAQIWPGGSKRLHRHSITVRILPPIIAADQTPAATDQARDAARAAIALALHA